MPLIDFRVFLIYVVLILVSGSVGRYVSAQMPWDADISLRPHDNETPVADLPAYLFSCFVGTFPPSNDSDWKCWLVFRILAFSSAACFPLTD